MRSLIAILASFIVAFSLVSAQGITDHLAPGVEIPHLTLRPIRYGQGPRESIHFISPDAHAPLVIRLDGADFDTAAASVSLGFIPSSFYEAGFAYADIDTNPAKYRDAQYIVTALAVAIGELVRDADKYGFDPRRIVLLGKGPEAHFAALLATDERHLAAVGVPLEAIRAVVSINGEGFDVTKRIATSSGFRASKYRAVFGNREEQGQLSPVTYIAPPNAPAFLFYVIDDDRELAEEATDFAGKLESSGARVEVRRLSPTMRTAYSTYIGAPQHPETTELLQFVRNSVSH